MSGSGRALGSGVGPKLVRVKASIRAKVKLSISARVKVDRRQRQCQGDRVRATRRGTVEVRDRVKAVLMFRVRVRRIGQSQGQGGVEGAG